jgi:hypothetical protein
MHVHFWPDEDVVISGLKKKVKPAHFLKNKENVKFTQDLYRVHLVGLP